MKLLIDTSAYSAFNRGDARLLPYFSPEHELLVPLIVVGELRSGFAGGNQAQRNIDLLERFLATDNVEAISITNQTTVYFGSICTQLRHKGRPINTNDMWIAAIALESGATLLTLDSDFQHIDSLRIAQL